MTSGGNNFNDFLRINLTNFVQTNTSNTAKLKRVKTYIPVCYVTNQHYFCVCAIVILSAFRNFYNKSKVK